MNVKKTKPHAPNVFDGIIRDALLRCRSLQTKDRIWLHREIVKACFVHTNECISGFVHAQGLALHRHHGLGRKRLRRLMDETQEIMDAYVARYDVAACDRLKADLMAEAKVKFESDIDHFEKE